MDYAALGKGWKGIDEFLVKVREIRTTKAKICMYINIIVYISGMSIGLVTKTLTK